MKILYCITKKNIRDLTLCLNTKKLKREKQLFPPKANRYRYILRSLLPGHFCRVLECGVAWSAHLLLLGSLAGQHGTLLHTPTAESKTALGARALAVKQREILGAAVARHFYWKNSELTKKFIHNNGYKWGFQHQCITAIYKVQQYFFLSISLVFFFSYIKMIEQTRQRLYR